MNQDRPARHIVAEELQAEAESSDVDPRDTTRMAAQVAAGASIAVLIAWVSIPIGLVALVAVGAALIPWRS